jgi:hypothetical protein
MPMAADNIAELRELGAEMRAQLLAEFHKLYFANQQAGALARITSTNAGKLKKMADDNLLDFPGEYRTPHDRDRDRWLAVAIDMFHSPPTRAPFSATERFISSTTGTNISVTTANSQKTSK